MDQGLVEYIKAARKAGQTNEEITKALVKIGWPEDKVNVVMSMDLSLPVPPLPPSSGPKVTPGALFNLNLECI